MIKTFLTHGLLYAFGCLALFINASAQKPKPKPVAVAAKPIVFAVLNDGTSLEPIAVVNKNKLEKTVGGDDDVKKIAAFNKTYYKPGTVYKLIFGTANAGTVKVKSASADSECGRNIAHAVASTTGTPLKGLVMGLATNVATKTSAKSSRRKPTPAEKTEMDALARAEFLKEKLTPKVLRFQNLTALDVDNDGKSEFVGSYWIEIDKTTRGLLFFIASQGSNGKYTIGYKEYRLIDQASVMSGEIKAVDDGVYHEMLLDAFDYDGDGTSEIFTNQAAFEGAGFNVYKRNGSKWTRVFEGSNYHCAF